MGLDLVTLAEFKAYAGISSTNSDNALKSIIPKVSQFVKSVCRTTFVDYVDEAKVEVYRTPFNGKIQLKEIPLIAIQSVEFSEDYGKSYLPLTEFTDYVVDDETGSVEFLGGVYPTYNRTNAFRLTYNAGYESIPEDLKLGVFDLISYYLQHDVSVHSPKNIGSNTVQIEYILTAQLPAHIRRVLSLYTSSYA